jgi:ketosteroid isomerase-like protein
MSQENVEIVQSIYAALSRGDREAPLRFFDPSIVVDASRRVFNPTTYVGMEGLRQMAVDSDEVWDEFHLEPLEFIEAGNSIVVIGRLVGKGKGSGVEVEQPIAGIWTLRDARVVRWEIGYTDRAKALEAVGLSEQDARADP